MKLPGTSIEFFHELAKQPKCICDRDIDKNAEKSILLNASTYLSDDHILIVNGIKKDIQTYIDKSNDQKDENLSRGSLTIAMLQIAIPSERKLLSTIYFRAISLSLWTSHHLSK